MSTMNYLNEGSVSPLVEPIKSESRNNIFIKSNKPQKRCKPSSAIEMAKSKKIKIGLCGGSPVWNLGSNLNQTKTKSDVSTTPHVIAKDLNTRLMSDQVANVGSNGTLTNESKTLSVEYDDYSEKDVVTAEVSLNSAAAAQNNDELSVIRNFDSSELNDIVMSSPLESSEIVEDYVLFAPDVVDYVDTESNLKDTCITSTKFEEYAISLQKSLNTSSFQKTSLVPIKGDANLAFTTPTTPALTGISASDCSDTLKQSFVDIIGDNVSTKSENKTEFLTSTKNVEVELLTSAETRNKTDLSGLKTITARMATVPNNMSKHKTVTYSRLSPAVGTNATVLNRGNVHPTIKSQPIVVTTKKLMAEVTQTTAKVSIGNTTISVPLLKPINSSQIISNDSQKPYIQPMQQQPNTQPQLSKLININQQPKILNVKRGQKMNPPTIVSLSQLQIKPSSNTKVVQATVVGKKIKLPHFSVDATATTSTVASTKANFIHTFSYPKLSQLTVLQDIALPNKIFEDESTSPISSCSSIPEMSEQFDQSESKTNLMQQIDYPQKFLVTKNKFCNIYSSAVSTTSQTSEKVSIVKSKSDHPLSEPQQNVANLNKILAANMPHLSPFSKPTEITSNITNVSQKLKTVTNNAPQAQKLLLTNIVDSSKSLSLHPTSSTTANVQDVRTARTTNTDTSVGGKNCSSPILTIPKTISLMLTKSAIPKTSIVTSLSSADASNLNNINLSKPTSANLTSTHLVPLQMGIASSKSSTVAVSVHVDTLSKGSKNVKLQQALTMPQLSSDFKPNYLEQLPIKRSKSTDDGFEKEHEMSAQSINSKRYSLEMLASKRSDSVDDNVSTCLSVSLKSAVVTTNSDTPAVVGNLNECGLIISSSLSKKSSSVYTTNTCTSNEPVKSEEAQNVLLKQLLQNSNSQNPTTMCSQVLSGRKVINVRAPSLGLVSSLEAQLARPVIPPVPTGNSILTTSKNPLKGIQNSANHLENFSKKSLSELNDKTKQSIQIISKETSFVSNPNPNRSPNSSPRTITQLSQTTKPIIVSTTAMDLTSLISTATPSTLPLTDSNSVNNYVPAQSNTCISAGSSIIAKNATSVATTFATISEGNKIMVQENSSEFRRTEIQKLQISNVQTNIKNNSESSNENVQLQRENTITKSKMHLTTSDTKEKKHLNVYNTEINTTITKEESNEVAAGYKMSQLTDKNMIFDKAAESLNIVNNTCTSAVGNIATSTSIAAALGTQQNYDAVKEVELRKKRKREYQKHRRQLLSNKEPCAVPCKKRCRKLSKVEEDYDGFIDNLMVQIRNMSSLQVLEPLLSRNFSICSMYGARDLSKISNSKEYLDSIQNEFLQGEFGSGKRANLADHYQIKPNSPHNFTIEKELSIIQNDFYDQEFSPVTENEIDKLCSLMNVLKERNIEMAENIVTSSFTSLSQQKTEHISKERNNMSYPGIVVINNSNSCMGRMSPIVPLVAPVLQATKNDIKCELSSEFENNFKNRTKTTLKETDPDLTVVLTITSTAAENILCVLRDLANILHIPTPESFKVINNTPNATLRQMGIYKLKRMTINNNRKTEEDSVDIQSIINGSCKLCSYCDVVIMFGAIRVKRNKFCTSLSATPDISLPLDDFHFCSKLCYIQFKNNDVLHMHSTRSFLNSQKTENLDNNPDSFIEDIKNPFLSLKSMGIDSLSGDKKKMLVKDKVHRYKLFNANCFNPKARFKKLSEKEVTDILFKMDITVAAHNICSNGVSISGIIGKMFEDTRYCIFCNQRGDGILDGPSRLLNFDVDKWVHLNCALWSNGVYETISGGLMNLEMALQAGLNQTCVSCHQLGATVKCFKNRCGSIYHLPCAIKEQCIFYKNKTIHCISHALKTEKENELITLSVLRRVYVERDESRQVAAVMHHSELSNLLRVGSLTFLNVGQLLPHQLDAFHTSNYIYPIGYKIIRFYWSMKNPNKRCRYICTIAEVAGRPEFRIQVQEPTETDIELRDLSPKAVWQRILEPIAELRRKHELVQLFPKFITGEDLFGLTEPSIVRILESLPGIETLTDYRFKYGRNPLLELPLAINPSGSARTEPKQRQMIAWKKPHTQRTGTSTNQRLTSAVTSLVAGEVACPYSKQFVHSKSSQYKKMKQEWRNNVYLARSKIQGLGLYAARDLEKHTMVIEYIGEVIRTEVSELREKQYESRNRGIYMFRLDEDRVVDATLSGGLARYINHSCNPNCVTEIVDVDREFRIIIFAKRRINRGEELSYDYKFDIEDDAHKISCMCGAPNCRKWMN